MTRVLCSVVVVAACVVAARGALAVPTTPAPTVLNDPDGLIAAYRELGLPMPPAGAVLVQFPGGSTSRNGGPFRDMLHLGFVLEKADGERPPLLLVGTRQARAEWIKPSLADPKRIDVSLLEAEWRDGGFEINAGLATAIQLRARGFAELAASVQAESLKYDVGHHFSPFRQRAGVAPRLALAHLAWSHWMNETVVPGSNRAAILKRMQALLVFEPELKDEAHQELLAALESSLVPSKAKAGTVEALIDSLVDFPYESEPPKGERDRDEPNPRVVELAVRAFESIPVLIEHLDDRRLTRGRMGGMDNAHTRHARIGEVVETLIEELAADEMERDYLYRFYRPGEKRAAALPWWERTRARGEEAYLVSHVLPAGRDRRFPYLLILRVIREKYPARLPEIFIRVVETRPDIAIHYVLKEIAASSLSRERKLELFTRAADSDDLEHRRAAYWELKRLDPAAFAERLLKTIEALPRTPKESYWHCREASFATLAAQTDDPRVWKALADAARRADVWLRMQYLDSVNRDEASPAQRRLRLALYAEFMNDPEVRQAVEPKGRPDTDSPYFGPYAARLFDRIEVRDFAAMRAAYLLTMDGAPRHDSNWTAERWADFRGRVGRAIEKELGPHR